MYGEGAVECSCSPGITHYEYHGPRRGWTTRGDSPLTGTITCERLSGWGDVARRRTFTPQHIARLPWQAALKILVGGYPRWCSGACSNPEVCTCLPTVGGPYHTGFLGDGVCYVLRLPACAAGWSSAVHGVGVRVRVLGLGLGLRLGLGLGLRTSSLSTRWYLLPRVRVRGWRGPPCSARRGPPAPTASPP